MKYVQTQKLLQSIKRNRWRYFCFPKRLHISYHPMIHLINQGMFSINFMYKNRHFRVAIGCQENEKPDYKFFTTTFFSAYKKLKYKIRKGLKPLMNTNRLEEKV